MKNMMEYKGYYGSVEYNDTDRLFYGQVQFIRALISYEGKDVETLHRDFESAVNDYLGSCKKTGKAPETPFKDSFNVRVGRKLHRHLVLAAAQKGLSLNKFVAEALEKVS